jgi:hypothetical protein
MKKLLLLFLPAFCLSQDLKITKDDFSNQTKIECTTQKQNAIVAGSISKEISLTLTCYANISESGNKFLYLSANIITSSMLCYSELDGKINFLFEDGTKLTLKQISKVKCNTTAIVKYQMTDIDLTTFLNSHIKKIRIETTDGYLEGSIKANKKQLIKDTFVTFKLNLPN